MGFGNLLRTAYRGFSGVSQGKDQISRARYGEVLAGVPIANQVEISSWVEDFNALIDRASVVVLPDLAGTGIKTRALQSMARGKPIVGTYVAFEDLAIPS